MPKYVAPERLDRLDRLASTLLSEAEQEEYAKQFGLEVRTSHTSPVEKQYDSLLRERLKKGGIRNRKHLLDACWALADYTGLPRIPMVAVCENHCSPFDALEGVFFHHATHALWHANRHGYKTMGQAFLMALESTTYDRCQSKILGGSGEQSKRVYEYFEKFGAVPSVQELMKSLLATRADFKNDSTVSILTQSMKSVLGAHPQKLRMDEIEEFEPRVFRGALSLTRSFADVPASILMASTHHKRFGLMANLLKHHKKMGIVLFQWCVFEVMEECKEKSCDKCKSVTKVDSGGQTISFFDICKGKAKRSRGYIKLSEVLEKFDLLAFDDFKAEWLSDFVSISGYVFPKFVEEEEKLHVTKLAVFDPELPLFRTWDFGWGKPTVCLWIQKKGRQIRIIDEEWRVMTPIPEMGRIILSRPYKANEVRDTGDPSGKAVEEVVGESDFQALAALGINVEGKGSGIPEGIKLINGALEITNGEVGLIVNPKCKHLIEYFSGAKYPTDAGGNVISEIPIKDNKEHPMDALRYWFINTQENSLEPSCLSGEEIVGDINVHLSERNLLGVGIFRNTVQGGRLFSVAKGRLFNKRGQPEPEEVKAEDKAKAEEKKQ
jgi:hypothetical protein